jgi:predicted enzyme related to lactoylglutathione lyase
MSGQNVTHFSVECDDVERAKRFYERVFGWRIVPWGPPNYYQIFTGTAEAPGILGDLRERHHPLGPDGGASGYVCTIGVVSLKDVLAAVEANGGRIHLKPYRIEGVGDLAYVEDSEGNRVGVMQHVAGLVVPDHQHL